jgi:NYN domain
MDSPTSERLAVFVDGENMSADIFDEIAAQACRFGMPIIWKVFGDLSNYSHANWLCVCRKHGLQPMIELPVESGKNSTDIAIVIAAMDLLLSSAVEALVLASDDRDFLPLVRQLRAGGMNVHGIGMKSENADLFRVHSSWTQLAPKAVPRIDARKIEAHNPVPAVKGASPIEPGPVLKRATITPAPQPDPLEVEFFKVVRAKLALGPLELKLLGSWIHDQHPKLRPFLGPRKLKKRLSADNRFKVSGNSVLLTN